MALTPYTSNDEVRAILGVNAIELPDAVTDLPIYRMGLLREIEKISESLPASFSAVNDVPEEQRTAQQDALYSAVRLFSAYCAARQVGVSLASMLPRSVGDGKATVSRFADAPYKETLAQIDKALGAARAALVATLEDGGEQVPARPVPALFRAVPRSYDPVTGIP